ncbi:MAG: hypothetical protein ACTSRG_23930 [Candidatus Helarchaeota archaeon]
MKRIFKCRICADEFKANENTNLKTCTNCRGKFDHQLNFKTRQKKIVLTLNYNLSSVKYVFTNGNYYITPCFEKLRLGNPISSLTNKRILVTYLENLKRAIEKDIMNTNNIKNVFLKKSEK